MPRARRSLTRPAATARRAAILVTLAVAASYGPDASVDPVRPAVARWPRAATAALQAAPPDLLAEAAVLQDLDSGQTLAADDGRERRPIASLTKIMTAVLALERLALEDLVTVGPNAAAQPGAAVGLVVGERVSVGDLLHAMMLASANEAAVALAEHLAGSEDAFVSLMNERAAELGLLDTIYFSATGLDDRGLSSARDVAALTRRAFGFPAFARIVRATSHRIPSPSGEARVVQTRNELLGTYEGAIGVKTGQTTLAGHCLVAAAERNGVRLLAVLLGHPEESFGDAAALLDHGYAAYAPVALVEPGERVGAIEVEGVEVPVVAGGGLTRLLPAGVVPSVTRRVVEDPGLELPVPPGAAVGRLVVDVDGRRIGAVRVLAATAAVRPGPSAGPPSTVGPPPNVAEALALARDLVEDIVVAFL